MATENALAGTTETLTSAQMEWLIEDIIKMHDDGVDFRETIRHCLSFGQRYESQKRLALDLEYADQSTLSAMLSGTRTFPVQVLPKITNKARCHFMVLALAVYSQIPANEIIELLEKLRTIQNRSRKC